MGHKEGLVPVRQPSPPRPDPIPSAPQVSTVTTPASHSAGDQGVLPLLRVPQIGEIAHDLQPRRHATPQRPAPATGNRPPPITTRAKPPQAKTRAVVGCGHGKQLIVGSTTPSNIRKKRLVAMNTHTHKKERDRECQSPYSTFTPKLKAPRMTSAGTRLRRTTVSQCKGKMVSA